MHHRCTRFLINTFICMLLAMVRGAATRKTVADSMK